MTAGFVLDPKLESTTIPFLRLTLCAVRIVNDARFPWLMLIPERDGLREIFELEASERAALGEEIALAARALKDSTGVEKINIGALGNVVAQLHIHIVGRSSNDAAWPGPVWGFGTAALFEASSLAEFTVRLTTSFRSLTTAALRT